MTERVVIKPRKTISVSGGKAHIPEEIRSELGTREIGYVCDAKTALLFNPETPAEEVLASLDILRKDLELRVTRLCAFCGRTNPTIHAMVNGNDVTVCTEKCIGKYSKQHPKARITVLEKY